MQDNIIKNKKAKEYEIPLEGSLGLLALGYRGLVAWREKREKEGYKTTNQILVSKKKKKKKVKKENNNNEDNK